MGMTSGGSRYGWTGRPTPIDQKLRAGRRCRIHIEAIFFVQIFNFWPLFIRKWTKSLQLQRGFRPDPHSAPGVLPLDPAAHWPRPSYRLAQHASITGASHSVLAMVRPLRKAWIRHCTWVALVRTCIRKPITNRLLTSTVMSNNANNIYR